MRGGGGGAGLQGWVAPGSVDRIFVNHPEPPERTGEATSEGAHLLTPAFFTAMASALKAKGTVTVVTDSLPYAMALAKVRRLPTPHPPF